MTPSHTPSTASAALPEGIVSHPLSSDVGLSTRRSRMPGTADLIAIANDEMPTASVSPNAFRWSAGRIALTLGVLVYLVVVLVLPLLALIVETVRTGIPAVIDALGAPDAQFAMRQSLVLMVIAVVVNAVVGVATAIVLVRQRFRGRALLEGCIDLSLSISPVMIGLAFLLVLGRDGWVWPWLEALGVRVAFAFPGMVIATLFVTLPYTIREVMHVLVEVGEDEEQVAATLGASWWRTFWRVTLPNVRRGLLLGLTLTAARALGEFGAVLVLGGAISRRTETATTYIFGATEERHEAGAYGMALLLGVVSMLILVIIEYFKQRRSAK